MTMTSFHVHLDESPGCVSFSTTMNDRKEIEFRAELAMNHAKEKGGVMVGPYDFDYERCPFHMGPKEEGEEKPESLAGSADDIDPYCVSEYASYRDGRQRWHVHTNDRGHLCSSFPDEGTAQWKVDRILRGVDSIPAHSRPRIIGPLDFPAIACSYYRNNMKDSS